MGSSSELVLDIAETLYNCEAKSNMKFLAK